MNYVQPYLETILQALVGLLVTLLLLALTSVRKKAEALLEARTTAVQRDMLHKAAKEAFAYAETAYRTSGGERKLQAAEAYLLQRLGDIGLQLSATELRAVVERAVLEYNAAVKPTEYIVQEKK